jgi:hypothetical protein
MPEELKVVITMREGKAAVGVQAPNCDPVLAVVQGGLADALTGVPALVARAREQWGTNKQYPKSTRAPAPAPPTPAARPIPTRAASKTKAAEAKEGGMKSMF